MGARYTPEDDAYLIAHYRTRPLAAIARDLGRDPDALRVRAGRLRRAGRLTREERFYHRAWTPREDRYLAAHWGARPDAEVAAYLGRTATACSLRARNHLRQNRRANLLNARQVALLFGVDPRTVVRLWVTRGWIWASRSAVRVGGGRRMWDVAEGSLRRFVTELPWAYDPAAMRAGHWLTELAREVHAADPWVTMAEAAALVHRNPGSVAQWVYRGWLPHQRRPTYHMRAGPHGGRIVVRRADVVRVAAALGDPGRLAFRRRGQTEWLEAVG